MNMDDHALLHEPQEAPEPPEDPQQLMRQLHGLLEMLPFDVLKSFYRVIWWAARMSTNPTPGRHRAPHTKGAQYGPEHPPTPRDRERPPQGRRSPARPPGGD
jgi:hypothetical protein